MVYAVRYCINHYIFAICFKKQYEMWILLFHGHFSNDTENENKSNPNINFKLMYMKQSMKSKGLQSPNQKIPNRKTKCVIETHLNIKQNVILGANLKPV